MWGWTKCEQYVQLASFKLKYKATVANCKAAWSHAAAPRRTRHHRADAGHVHLHCATPPGTVRLMYMYLSSDVKRSLSAYAVFDLFSDPKKEPKMKLYQMLLAVGWCAFLKSNSFSLFQCVPAHASFRNTLQSVAVQWVNSVVASTIAIIKQRLRSRTALVVATCLQISCLLNPSPKASKMPAIQNRPISKNIDR
jgi:hypothetical protein